MEENPGTQAFKTQGRQVGRLSLYVHSGRRPASNLLLTTPISPGSVSVCFTVTWITELGRFRASIIMATLSGTVLLFLLGREASDKEYKVNYGSGRPCKEFTSILCQSICRFYEESFSIYMYPLLLCAG